MPLLCCALSTVSLCELKIKAQVQVLAWTLISTFFSDHRNELILIWTLWNIYNSGFKGTRRTKFELAKKASSSRFWTKEGTARLVTYLSGKSIQSERKNQIHDCPYLAAPGLLWPNQRLTPTLNKDRPFRFVTISCKVLNCFSTWGIKPLMAKLEKEINDVSIISGARIYHWKLK